MKIFFQTNLDDAQSDVRELNDNISSLRNSCGEMPVPRVGEKIRFPFKRYSREMRSTQTFEFSLEVTSVSYTYEAGGAYAILDLHIPKYQAMSIADWMAWFKRHRRGEE